MMTPTLKAHIALFSAQIIYALNYSIAKDVMPLYVSPFGLVMLRIAGACILFWSASFFIPKEKIETADLKKLIYLALFGVVINQAFFIYGLSLTKPINSAIIMISNPIAVMIFTLFILKEQITKFKVLGLLFGITGALTLLLFRGQFSFGSETAMGDLMTLVNSMSWAIFVVMIKPFMQKYQTITVMKWCFLFGLIYFFPIGIKDVFTINWHQIPTSIILSILFIVIATTFFAYLLNMYALKALSSSVVSMYIYFQPFLATLFAVWLGKDEITPIKLLSAFFIITGVYLVSAKKELKVT